MSSVNFKSMQINKKTKTITINGLDLLKAMENAKTPINPFYKQKGKNVKNKTKPRVSEQDCKTYESAS